MAGPEQADYVPRRVRKAGFPPEPTFVRRKLRELKACAQKVLNLEVQVSTLEVHNDPGTSS